MRTPRTERMIHGVSTPYVGESGVQTVTVVVVVGSCGGITGGSTGGGGGRKSAIVLNANIFRIFSKIKVNTARFNCWLNHSKIKILIWIWELLLEVLKVDHLTIGEKGDVSPFLSLRIFPNVDSSSIFFNLDAGLTNITD